MKLVFSLMSVCFVLSSVASAQVARVTTSNTNTNTITNTNTNTETSTRQWSTNTNTTYSTYGTTYDLVRVGEAGYDVYMSRGAQLDSRNIMTQTQVSKSPHFYGTLIVRTPFENITHCLGTHVYPKSGRQYPKMIGLKSQRDLLMVVRIIEDQAKSINLETKNELKRLLKINEDELKNNKIIMGSCQSAMNTWIKDFNQRNR